MPESIAVGNFIDAERDILAELETALCEHIALVLEWNRRLLVRDGDTPSPADIPAPPADRPHAYTHAHNHAHAHADDHDCNFGAWYALNQHNRLIDQPAIKSLAATHEQLHAAARRLLEHFDHDGEIDAAEYDAMALRAESFFAQIRRIERAFRTARSDVDPLTGAYNRQTMLSDLEIERERAIRSRSTAAIALVDLDLFKAVNDTHGHQNGDLVLQSVASILQSHVRPFDKVYRYGGEEFLICLPNADMRQTARVLERLRRVIEASPVKLGNGTLLKITTSIGAAPITADRQIGQIIEKADRALYAAKNNGRNCVRVWRQPTEAPPASVATTPKNEIPPL
ncbi:diguanylate cyclase [Thalassospira mesophila]|uniref:diguanylate cyclase n=2 Tax=Thalassospira mesophila TaxID=1293891 RepID=A0A1Y2L3Z5_9PROT|nr:diguanylate cyclase [Thalassospira mesophila]